MGGPLFLSLSLFLGLAKKEDARPLLSSSLSSCSFFPSLVRLFLRGEVFVILNLGLAQNQF